MDASRERRILSFLVDDPSLILLIKSKYITSRMWQVSLQKEPSLFKYMRDPSEEMCLFALEEDGSNLKYLIDHYPNKVTQEMIRIAIRSYPPAIFYLPSEERTDPLKELAVDTDPSLLRDFPRMRRSYLRRKIYECPWAIQYLREPDEELYLIAIDRDINVCGYIKYYTKRMKELIARKSPNMVELLSHRVDFSDVAEETSSNTEVTASV